MPLPTLKDVTLVNPVLTDLSIGYQNESLIWNKLAPPKGEPVKVGTYPIYTRDYWFRRVNDAGRSEGGGYSRAGYGISSDTYATMEIGFEKALSDDVKKANQSGDDLAEVDTAFLTTLMELEFEKRIAAAAFITGVWGTSTTLTLTDQWSDFDGSDPIDKIKVAMRTIRRNIGSFVSVIGICGPLTWEKLSEHPLIIDKYKHTQKGIMTEALVAAVLGLDEIIVGYAIENTAVEKAPGTASFTGADIFTDNFLVLAKSTRGQGAYTFIWEEDFTQPWTIESYRDDSVRSDITRIRTHPVVKISSAQHGYMYLDCVA